MYWNPLFYLTLTFLWEYDAIYTNNSDNMYPLHVALKIQDGPSSVFVYHHDADGPVLNATQ